MVITTRTYVAPLSWSVQNMNCLLVQIINVFYAIPWVTIFDMKWRQATFDNKIIVVLFIYIAPRLCLILDQTDKAILKYVYVFVIVKKSNTDFNRCQWWQWFIPFFKTCKYFTSYLKCVKKVFCKMLLHIATIDMNIRWTSQTM